MSSPLDPVVAGRTWPRRLAGAVGAAIAVVAALAASLVALYCLEWGGDSGPFPVAVSVPPAAVSLVIVRWLVAAAAARVPRTAIAVGVGALGLASWAVALTAAFDTQSAYTSTCGSPAPTMPSPAPARSDCMTPSTTSASSATGSRTTNPSTPATYTHILDTAERITPRLAWWIDTTSRVPDLLAHRPT